MKYKTHGNPAYYHLCTSFFSIEKDLDEVECIISNRNIKKALIHKYACIIWKVFPSLHVQLFYDKGEQKREITEPLHSPGTFS